MLECELPEGLNLHTLTLIEELGTDGPGGEGDATTREGPSAAFSFPIHLAPYFILEDNYLTV